MARPALHDNRYRVYDSACGAYLQADVLVAKSWSPYAYAGGSPVYFIDPTGRIDTGRNSNSGFADALMGCYTGMMSGIDECGGGTSPIACMACMGTSEFICAMCVGGLADEYYLSAADEAFYAEGCTNISEATCGFFPVPGDDLSFSVLGDELSQVLDPRVDPTIDRAEPVSSLVVDSPVSSDGLSYRARAIGGSQTRGR